MLLAAGLPWRLFSLPLFFLTNILHGYLLGIAANAAVSIGSISTMILASSSKSFAYSSPVAMPSLLSSLAITAYPKEGAQIGKPAVITYMSDTPDKPATIILRKGDPSNLETIQTITTSATGGSFSWIPSPDLPPAADYAIQIVQESETNYAGPFEIKKSPDSSSLFLSSKLGGQAKPATSSSNWNSLNTIPTASSFLTLTPPSSVADSSLTSARPTDTSGIGRPSDIPDSGNPARESASLTDSNGSSTRSGDNSAGDSTVKTAAKDSKPNTATFAPVPFNSTRSSDAATLVRTVRAVLGIGIFGSWVGAFMNAELLVIGFLMVLSTVIIG